MEQDKTEQAKPETKTETKPKTEVKTDKPEGVKVTKGGIIKYVDPSQAATYKANGWK